MDWQAEVKKMSQKFIALLGKTGLATVVWLILLSFCRSAFASDLPAIFPLPQEIELLENHFNLDEQTSILLPAKAPEKDRFLARFLVAELSDRYGLAVKVVTVQRLPASQPFILIGSIANPLVRQYCAERRLAITAQKPGPEGYFLHVDEQAVVIAGSDERGAFYGLQ
ncbi:MAG: glycoside hydrolase family 20 zincin-like fold domain-containing protein, partial [Blastocatellia bacterium]